MLFKNKKTQERKFKFKSLKVYASPTPLVEGDRQYRRVFDSNELSFLYVELAFFNKMTEEGDWNAVISLKCYRLGQPVKEELCDISLVTEVSTHQPVVYVRQGWGNEEVGYYWKRGDYVWEAHINGEMVGTTHFYVEDGGLVTVYNNPYFFLTSIFLYEGPSNGVETIERRYLSKFDAESTRFVWVEVMLENIQVNAWFCEMMFSFYDQNRHLKGRMTEIRQIKSNEKEVTILTGWGAEKAGSWEPGNYSLEILFMNQLVGVVPFEVGEGEEEGLLPMFTNDEISISRKPHFGELVPQPQESMDDLLAELDQLVGMTDIKAQVRNHIQYLEFLKLRQEAGYEEKKQAQLHSVFMGNPGTGKTTIARLLGRIYHAMGLLSQGQLHEVGRAELIGQYIGQTAPRVKDVIEGARGGVLFIDEAYALARNAEDDKDFGREAIEILVKEMSDGPGDIAIFVAGYPKEMATFLQSNPGLKSRFRLYFQFPDYQPSELVQIAQLAAQQQHIEFTASAVEFLQLRLTEHFRSRDRYFGNARFVVNVVEDTKMQLGIRLMQQLKEKGAKPTKNQLKMVHVVDVRKVFAQKSPSHLQIGIDHEELQHFLDQLNSLTGLKEVKKSVNELIQLAQFHIESGHQVLGKLSLHAIFKGNPGTGKTTVARLMAHIYKALGLLERGHLVECNRKDLVAGFVGQTAIKTQELLEKAKGGVLFVDEAYSLFSESGSNDFGREAVEVILKEMEDRRGEFVVIMAGYTGEMEQLLHMNPGLRSRFDHELVFQDFSADELVQVAEGMLRQAALIPEPAAKAHIRTYLESLEAYKDKYFGNAREVRKMMDKAIRNQHLRLAALPKEKRSQRKRGELLLIDVAQFTPDVAAKHFRRKKMGF